MGWDLDSAHRHPCPCGRGEYEESYWSDDWGRGETRYEMLCPDCKQRYAYVRQSVGGYGGPLTQAPGQDGGPLIVQVKGVDEQLALVQQPVADTHRRPAATQSPAD